MDGSFDGYDDGKFEGLFLGGSLVSTDDKALGSNEGIKLGSTDVKFLGTILGILGNVYGITLGIDIRTKLGFLDGSFDVSNDGNLEGLLLGDSLRSTDGKLLGSDEGTTQAGLTWSGLFVVVVGWVFGGVGCYATIKGAELGCEIDYAV